MCLLSVTIDLVSIMYSSRKYLQGVVCLTQLRDQTHANWSKILAVCAHSIGILPGFQFLHPYCSSLQTSQPSLATLWPNGVRDIGPLDQQWIREYLVQIEWTWNQPRLPSTNAPTLRSKPVCGIDHPQLRDSTVGRSILSMTACERRVLKSYLDLDLERRKWWVTLSLLLAVLL